MPNFYGKHFILTPFRGAENSFSNILSGLRHITDTIYHIWKSQLGGPSIILRIIYSLYKKKRKPYIMFNTSNSSPFKDEHFKLAGYLDWYVPYQQVEFHIFSCTKTARFLSSCKGTHKTKSHKHNT